MKMKKWMALILAGGLLVSSLAGCGSSKGVTEADTESAAAENVPEYEYVIRDLPEPQYMEAAEVFAGGTGTEDDPYQIATAAELALMEKVIREEESVEYAAAHYVLIEDIVLNDTSDFEQWAEKEPEYSWRPIGGEGTQSFKGSFDGAGHSISGMYINLNNESEEKAYGLFDTVWGAVIRDVTLDKSYLSVSGVETSVGGIAAIATEESLITGCTSNVVIDVYDGNIGGVCGSVWGGRSGTDDIEYTEEDDQRGPFSTVENCTFGGTIRQIREDSMSTLGGIAGGNDGDLVNCINRGTVCFGALNTDVAGGVVGAGGGIISGCENAGTLECTLEDGVMSADTTVRAGGIAGKMYMSSVGSKKYMSRVAVITDCKNTGTVSGTMSVGGIVGEASNDRNDWCLRIEDCVNSGQVISLTGDSTGGIAGKLGCQGDNDHGNNLVVENCRNDAELTRGNVGGVAGLMMTYSGDVLIKDCVNTGRLNTSEDGLYSGGIIAQWIFTLGDDDDIANVALERCSNEGAVNAPLSAGGILGFADCPVQKTGNGSSTLKVTCCSNRGDVSVMQVNGYLGGITGCWGMAGVPGSIENCTNTGTLFINNKVLTQEQKEEIENSLTFTISRIGGGIVGKVGKGVYLSTDNDEVNSEYINAEDAFLTLKDCSSTGEIRINDAEEYKDKTGRVVYRNYIGGIIGNASGEEAYSVRVENCTYSGTERGLGNEDLSDLGEKK